MALSRLTETGLLRSAQRTQVQIPEGAQVVNAKGKTTIPGLISAHSHLGLCEGAIGPKPENYKHDNVRHQLEQYERYGVLSVMALGCNKDVLCSWREEQRRGELDGADIFIVGVIFVGWQRPARSAACPSR